MYTKSVYNTDVKLYSVMSFSLVISVCRRFSNPNVGTLFKFARFNENNPTAILRVLPEHDPYGFETRSSLKKF